MIKSSIKFEMKAIHLFVGYSNPPQIPEISEIRPYQPIYFDSVYRDQSVRVIYSREFISSMDTPGWVDIYVWQTQARTKTTPS